MYSKDGVKLPTFTVMNKMLYSLLNVNFWTISAQIGFQYNILYTSAFSTKCFFSVIKKWIQFKLLL